MEGPKQAPPMSSNYAKQKLTKRRQVWTDL